MTITGQNDGPTPAAESRTIDGDDDGTTLTYEIIGAPAEGTATLSGTMLSFDPGVGFQDLGVGENRDVEVLISATDRHGATAVSTITYTFLGQNDAPVANDDFTTVGEGDVKAVSLIDNDVDPDLGDTLRIVEVSGSVSLGTFAAVESDGGRTGKVLIGETSAIFDMNGGFEDLAVGETDTVRISYVIEDESGARAEADLVITITGQNDAPTIEGFARSTREDQSFTVNLALFADDLDTDDVASTLTYEVVGAPSGGSASISGTSLTFGPSSSFRDLPDGESQDVDIVVQATDQHGGTATAR